MANLAVLERQQQFDFQQNGIEVMDFETLQRTYKENDIYNNPVQGIYHYQVIQRMMDICEKHNLDYEVEEIFAAQNRNKTQPGVSILPQVEQIHGEKAVEAHILRRIFTTIRIKDWETDELTTTLVVAYHQDGVQAAIGPCVKICHNQCILSPERSVCNYGKKKVTTEELFDTVDGWMANFEVNMNEDIERIEIETQSYPFGRNIYVYRTVDGIACFPRQRGQEPFLHRGDLSLESGADIGIHGRGAEAGNDKGTDYRLGSLQCRYGDIQTW